MTAMLDQAGVRTAMLSQFVAAPPATNERQLEAARLVLVDTVGVATAGARTPGYAIVREWLHAGTRGATALWGTGETADPAAAALLNGLAGHALDWDDASPTRWLHAGTVLWPALLAGIRPGVTGADLVRGYSVGSTLFRALSDVLPLGVHYGRGWHNTSSTGRLAAAAAVASARGLGPDRVATSLGLVTATAAGTLANFGTMTKPLGAGLAARDALMAVDLVELGFTASVNIIDDPRGFIGLYGDAEVSATINLAERLEACWNQWPADYAIKRFPSCYATQRAIDAARELRPRLDSAPARVEVFVESDGLLPLRAGAPTTGLEAKFSLPYTVAVALLTGEVHLADFADDAIGRTDVTALQRRIECRETDTPPLGPPLAGTQATVMRITTVSGRQHITRVDHARGDARNPLDPADLVAKFAESADLPDDHALARVDDLGALLETSDLSSAQFLLSRPSTPRS